MHVPSVVAFGLTKDSPSDIKVVIERQNVMPMSSMVDALHYCLFLEKYVYGLKPSQKLPISVSILYDSLEKNF